VHEAAWGLCIKRIADYVLLISYPLKEVREEIWIVVHLSKKLVLLVAAPAIAQGNRTLTMVTSVPDGFAIFDDAAQLAIDYIAAMTDGQLTSTRCPPVRSLVRVRSVRRRVVRPGRRLPLG
jgi:hypothetical protein